MEPDQNWLAGIFDPLLWVMIFGTMILLGIASVVMRRYVSEDNNKISISDDILSTIAVYLNQSDYQNQNKSIIHKFITNFFYSSFEIGRISSATKSNVPDQGSLYLHNISIVQFVPVVQHVHESSNFSVQGFEYIG